MTVDPSGLDGLPRRRRRHFRRRALGALTLTLASAVAFTGFGSAIARAVPATNLASLLLSPDDISGRVGAEMQVVGGESGTQPLTDPTVTPSNCTGIDTPGSSASYSDSGFTDIAVQTLREPGGDLFPMVVQAVATFPNIKAAQAFLSAQADAWRQCKSSLNFQPLTADYPDGMSVGLKPGGIGGSNPLELLTSLFKVPSSSGAGCDRVMQAKDNAVVDVVACMNTNAGGRGTAIRSAIIRNFS